MSQLFYAETLIEMNKRLAALRAAVPMDNIEAALLLGDIANMSIQLAQGVLDGKAEFILTDETTQETIKVHAKVSTYGLYIGADGYSDNSSTKDGEFLELDWFDSRLKVVVWDDINNPEPTHNISLENAKISNREED